MVEQNPNSKPAVVYEQHEVTYLPGPIFSGTKYERFLESLHTHRSRYTTGKPNDPQDPLRFVLPDENDDKGPKYILAIASQHGLHCETIAELTRALLGSGHAALYEDGDGSPMVGVLFERDRIDDPYHNLD